MAYFAVALTKKARMFKFRMKAMLIVIFVFFVVHSEFVPVGQKVNDAFYMEVLKRIKEWVKRVRLKIGTKWKLHHDNVLSHISFVVTKYQEKFSS